MAGITQTVPSFTSGISEQPDHLKFQGQVRDVVNAIPDVTYGLFKRPGSKRIDTSQADPSKDETKDKWRPGKDILHWATP